MHRKNVVGYCNSENIVDIRRSPDRSPFPWRLSHDRYFETVSRFLHHYSANKQPIKRERNRSQTDSFPCKSIVTTVPGLPLLSTSIELDRSLLARNRR